jgi:SAM-dependent methyltransferase
MIERYKANTDNFGLPQDEVNAVVGNLLLDPPEPPSLAGAEYCDFDLITVGQALHFFPSAGEAVRCLSKLLKPGGVLFIQDLYVNERKIEGAGGKKRPRGYTEDGMKALMSGAGLEEFRFEVLGEEFDVELPSEEVMKVQYFIAGARKGLS